MTDTQDAARYIAGSHCCHSLWQKEYTGYTLPPYFLLHPISNSIHEVIHLYKVYRKALVNRMAVYAGFHYKACRGASIKSITAYVSFLSTYRPYLIGSRLHTESNAAEKESTVIPL